MTGVQRLLPIQPRSPGLPERIWWGAGTRATAVWAAEQGMNLMSSTLLTEDTGVAFGELQAEQIAGFRAAWSAAGREREPRVSVSRSIMPIVARRRSRSSSGTRAARRRGPGRLSRRRDGAVRAQLHRRAGRDREELGRDPAVVEADTLLLTVPNQLGVEYNAHLLRTIAEHVAPAIGWRAAAQQSAARDRQSSGSTGTRCPSAQIMNQGPGRHTPSSSRCHRTSTRCTAASHSWHGGEARARSRLSTWRDRLGDDGRRAPSRARPCAGPIGHNVPSGAFLNPEHQWCR